MINHQDEGGTGAFLEAYGKTLGQLERYAENKSTIKAINALVDLYDAWHAAEPDPGVRRDYAAKAAEWRAKLPEENGE